MPIRPGTYGALALGIANVIINSELYDKAFVRDYTYGFEDFKDESGTVHMGFRRLVLERYTLERTAAITGVAAADIARIAGEFATNRPAVAMLPLEAQGLGCGEDVPAAMAIHALNALVGSIDRPGGVLVQRFPTVKKWPQAQPDSAAGAGLAHERVDGAGSDSMPLATSAAALLPERILAGSPYGVTRSSC